MEHKGDWMVTLDAVSPTAGCVCFSAEAGERTAIQPGSAGGSVCPGRLCLPGEETLTGPLYRLNLIRKFPGSRDVISSPRSCI